MFSRASFDMWGTGAVTATAATEAEAEAVAGAPIIWLSSDADDNEKGCV